MFLLTLSWFGFFFFFCDQGIVVTIWRLYLAIDLGCAKLFLVPGGFQNDCILFNSADCCHFIHSFSFFYTVTYTFTYSLPIFCSIIHNFNFTCSSLSNHTE